MLGSCDILHGSTFLSGMVSDCAFGLGFAFVLAMEAPSSPPPTRSTASCLSGGSFAYLNKKRPIQMGAMYARQSLTEWDHFIGYPGDIYAPNTCSRKRM